MKKSHGNRLPGKTNSVKAKCHPDRLHEALGLCNSCYTIKKHKQKYKNNPAAGRRHKVKLQLNSYRKSHGWTVEMLEEAKRVQRNRCAICRVIMHDPQADHEHTNPPNPRELLCRPCNIGLGHFKDNPELLRKAAKYVEKHRN